MTMNVCQIQFVKPSVWLQCLDRHYFQHNPKEPMEWVLISFFYHNSDFIGTDDLPINM